MKGRESASTTSLESLACAAGAGDSAAGEELYALARGKLVAMALALGVAGDDVPDLVQDVLIAAWRNLDRFDAEKGTFIGWLAPGLRGRAKNRFRGQRRRQGLLTRLWTARSSAPPARREPHAALDARMTVARLVESLSRRQREVVALYELGDLSSQETARVLGIGAAAVRSIARDARARLKEESLRMERHETLREAEGRSGGGPG